MQILQAITVIELLSVALINAIENNICQGSNWNNKNVAHEFDCSKYYQCNYGIPLERTCPLTEQFDSVLGTCSSDVECRTGTHNDGIGYNGFEAYRTQPQESINDQFKVSDLQKTCPQWYDGNDIYYPDSSNCHKYYQCNYGKLVENICQSDLYFNPETTLCDFYYNVDCRNEVSDNEDETETEEEKCPSWYDGNDIYYPHEQLCEKYYQCNYGSLVENACISGLHFNGKTNLCDWPDNSNCTLTVTDKENGNESTGSYNCPNWYEGKEILYEHEHKCEKYYQCNFGELVERVCPEHSYFNPITKQCDWSGNVECSNDRTGTSEQIDDNESLLCLPHRYALNIFIPHPTNCSKFLECVYGIPVERTCLHNFYFNSKINGCDWHENVMCPNDGTYIGASTSQYNVDEDTNGQDAGENEQKEYECPSDKHNLNILLPHPNNCTKYLECNYGTAIERKCPSNQYFNPIAAYCDWLENGKCLHHSTAEDEEDTSGERICPTDNGDVVFLAHKNSCTKYVQCNHGISMELECPTSLYFNPLIGKCDWPNNVECSHDDIDRNNIDGYEDLDDTLILNEQCPSGTHTRNVFLSHPRSCTKYIQCVNGKQVVRDCPLGLRFNPLTTVCDWLLTATNTDNIQCRSGESEDGVSDEEGGTGSSERIKGNEAKCPSDSNTLDVLLAHTTDCTKYFQCVHGKPVERDCPSELHFNSKTDRCDYPENVHCHDSSEETTEGYEYTSSEGQFNNENKCPLDSRGADIIYSHDRDCSKFYQCDYGEAKEQQCPPGLFFDPETWTCDWPENVNCQYSSEGIQGLLAAAVLLNSAPFLLGKHECPPDAIEDDILLPHPKNCSQFQQCVHGEPVDRDCPTGLYFNPDTYLCDWPSNTSCENDSSSDEIDSNELGSLNTSEQTCPSKKEGEDTLLPHESDCTKFYKCDSGIKVSEDCPRGLYFNVIDNTCNWPETSYCFVNKSISNQDKPSTPCSSDLQNNYFVPHEYDCRQFYICRNGVQNVFKCPPGLYFNLDANSCEEPEEISCTFPEEEEEKEEPPATK